MSSQTAVNAAVDRTESEEQQAEVQALFERLGPAFEEERLRIAQLLASKEDRQLFGQTEFELRDRVHRLAARSLEVAASERQKKGWVRGC